MTPGGKLCTFRLDGLLFGIPAAGVQEVLRHQPITPLPLAPPGVAGLINLRGQIIAVIDLRHTLGMAVPGPRETSSHLVLRTPHGPVSLLVEAISDVIEVGGRCLEPPPDTVQAQLRRLLTGVCPLPGELLLLLDANRALSCIGSNEG